MSSDMIEVLALEKLDRYTHEAALAQALERPALRVRLARALNAIASRLDGDASYRHHPQVS